MLGPVQQPGQVGQSTDGRVQSSRVANPDFDAVAHDVAVTSRRCSDLDVDGYRSIGPLSRTREGTAKGVSCQVTN